MPDDRITVQEAYEMFIRLFDDQFEIAKKNPHVPREKALAVALGTTMRTFEIVGGLL